MPNWLKQSTAANVLVGQVVSVAAAAPYTTDDLVQANAKVSKNGGAQATKNDATALTHDAAGWFIVPLDATDTGTLGTLKVILRVTDQIDAWASFEVVPANVYNSVVAGSDKLYVDAVEINSSTAAAARQALAAGIVIPGTVFDDAGTYAASNSGSLIFYSDDVTEATADHYNGRVVIFTSGALLGQALAISDYEKVASYGKLTCSLATEVPADDDTFVIV